MSFGSSPDAELYEQVLVPALYEPWARTLVERARLEHGHAVLDIACGTGIVARVARQLVGQESHVVGIDRSADMLAVARRIEPTIDWREGIAEELPVREDERVDVVFCQQGIQFFSDKNAAIRQMHRVLRPGGRAVVGVWRAIGENGVFGDMAVIVERILGRVNDARYHFADPGALKRLFIDAGFRDVRVDRESRRTRYAGDPIVLARLNATIVVAMSDARTRPEGERAALVSAIADATVNQIRMRVEFEDFSFPTGANMVVAQV